MTLFLLLIMCRQDLEARQDLRVDYVETVTLVHLPLKVSHKGSRYKDLDIEDVHIIENGVKVELENLKQVETTLTMHFLFDLSTSNDRHIFQAKRTARDLIQKMRKGDLARISFFSSSYQPLSKYTSDRDTLLGALARLSSVGSTALYDGISSAVDDLSRRSGNRLLILFRDGHDLLSRVSEGELMTMIKNFKIPIFFVAYSNLEDKGYLLEAQTRFMKALARESGGGTLEAGFDLTRSLSRRLKEQRRRYLVSFMPPGSDNTGLWRSLVVNIQSCPDCELEYRRAYQIAAQK